MIVGSIRNIDMTPSLGALIGTTASTSVLDTINQTHGNHGGVVFGQPGDPYLNRYQAFQTNVLNRLYNTNMILQETIKEVVRPLDLTAITSEEELRHTPVSMQLPILMYKPVRELFEEGRIDGYGFHKETLPEEDFFGRLIGNGEIVCDKDHYEDQKIPEFMEWEWKTTDPNLSEKELDAIDTTRRWIDSWLSQQMGENGSMLDPTDPSNKIGKAKKKK